MVGIRGLWDKINMGDFLSIIGNIAEGANVAVQAIFRGVLALLLWFPANLDAISDAMVAILKIVAVLLALILVFVIARGVYKKTGIVIMPFEVSLGEGGTIRGRAISDLLAGELRRISEVHRLKFEEITIKSESLSLPALTPKGESLEHSMPQVATVGDGQASLVGISISHIIIAFRRHCPGTTPVPVLSGSLQKYGRMIALTASLEDRGVRAWDVERKVREKDQVSEEQIPSMVRDLAYRIVHDLSRDGPQGIEAKTWQGLKHFTDALAFYHSYTLTGDLRELDRSRSICVKAVHSEKGYEMAIDFLKVLGYIYISIIKYDEAEWIFGHLKAFRPEEAAVGIGDVFWSRGDMTEARFYFNDAQRINPNFALGWLAEGDLLYYLGDYDEALEVYNIATKKNPNLIEAWRKKADILLSLGRHEEALQAYDAALMVDPKFALAWSGKCSALINLRRHTEALDSCEEALRLNPNMTRIWCLKGRQLYEIGRYKESLEASEKALELDPQSSAWDTKGAALSELGKYEDAIECFSKSLDHNPQNGEAWFHKSEALRSLDRTSEADATLARARELGYKDASESSPSDRRESV
jgi:tetratricopeptide (TPR) repeat protein